ncbi:MAG: peptidylprolyl isomerase [bacterium]
MQQHKGTRSRRVGLGVLCVVVLTLPALGGTADSIAAVVGERVILKSQLDQAVLFTRLATGDTVRPDTTLEREALDRLIDDEVLQQQAVIDSVEASDAEAEAEANVSIAALVERLGGEEGFAAALAAEGLTEKALRARYADEARRKLVARRLLEKAGLTQVYISPSEAERFYIEARDSIARVPGQVRLAHVLVAVTPGAAAESSGQRRMLEVLDVLQRGGDFATVAGSFSDDRRTAGRGGDWGRMPLESLPMDIGMVLSQLKPGQVSPPFRTREGYLTVRLESLGERYVRFRSILIRVPVTRADTARARDLAATVRRAAASGEPFDSLARRYSSDPVTADSGGLLGDFPLEALTPPFDTVVAALDSGEISQPVKSEHGFHIIKVLEKQDERMMSYLEMQDDIRNYLYQQKFAERVAEYVERIRKKIFIKRYRQG